MQNARVGVELQTRILVAYATRGGSTGEVAQVIGECLLQEGLPAEVRAMGDIESVEGCTAVVLGAPLYMGRFPREVNRFLVRTRTALAEKKAWFFALGPVEGKPEEFAAAAAQARNHLAKFGWFKPAELRIFGGKFDANHMPFRFSLARFLPGSPAKNLRARDMRDWGAIRTWAEGIARQLQPDECQLDGKCSPLSPYRS